MVQKSGVYQLRLVVYLITYRVLHIPGGARFLPSTGGGEKQKGTRKVEKMLILGSTPHSVTVTRKRSSQLGSWKNEQIIDLY